MKIKGVSSWKNSTDKKWLESWIHKIQELNNSFYEKKIIETSLGQTVVFSFNEDRNDLEPIVIFPGARTHPLFWDLNNGLGALKDNFRIFLVDVNGQPGLSDGNSPSIQTDDYGIWAEEVIDKLGLKETNIAGASLGGLICLKLCIAAPQKIKKAILLNPAGIQPFSLKPKNLYYNILPLILPTRANVAKFLNNAVFHNASHTLPNAFMDLIIDNEYHAIKRFNAKAENPAKALPASELKKIKTPVYLILGDKDILFPYERTIENALKNISSLSEIYVLPGTAHGIETSDKAISIVKNILNETPETAYIRYVKNA